MRQALLGGKHGSPARASSGREMVEWQRETKKKAASSIRLAGKGVSLSLQEVQLLETLIPGNGWSLRAIPVSWQGVKGKCVENKREEFLERERTEKQ